MSGDGPTDRARSVAITIVAVVAVASAVGSAFWVAEPGASCPLPTAVPLATQSPIQHVFFIIKENHAFENYFGTFPGVVGYPPNGSLPLAFGSNQTVAPFPLNGSSTPDLPHDRASELVDLDGGKNDGFVAGAAAEGYADSKDAVGFYTAAQIPDYFEYAHSFALGDEFFSGILGPTLPNRFFDLAATSGNWTSDIPPPPEAVAFPTILNELSEHGIPWNYDYTGSELGLTPLYLPAIADDPCLVARIQPVSDLT
ncbi:MAG: alkaline phosphatase family protein, partial [Thermoplasmata archaeon]